jgi:3',5'-cyclic AMP phosphodiesterase CpdA
MRLLVTADLHYNHPKSRPLAGELITQMNAAGGDVLLVVGDTAVTAGDALEQCLGRFRFAGPKLFVAGNHELWTNGSDSYGLYTDELPRRVRAMGWQWLETNPFVADGGDVAIVGSVGWYDYSFAQADLGIPRRFYAAKVSPGAAERLAEHAELIADASDLSPVAREVVARWNDGRFVKLGRTDEAFLDELMERLHSQLASLAQVPNVVAAIHHLPFRELLPPPRSAQWDFAKAYLGSERLGELLLRYPNVRTALCGHSHYAAEATVGHVHATNIGSGYGWKTFRTVDVGV